MPPTLPQDGQPQWLTEPAFGFSSRALAVTLSGGETLMVGYDAKFLTNLREVLIQTLIWSCIITLILSAGIGAFLGLGPIRRVSQVRKISSKIASGSFDHRLPVSTVGDELDTLSRLVNAMIDEVSAMLDNVKSIGDNVAHDLRTPLNQLRGQLHRALEQWDVDDRYVQRERVVKALDATNTVLERFRALQRISEIDNRSRSAAMKLTDLNELFEEMAESYAALAQEAGIGFETKIERAEPVMADKHILAEMLSNLLENALKFTPPRGTVTLSLLRPHASIVIEVRDTGPGIPEEDRDKVLYRFGRSNRDQNVPGAGLGLAIVSAGAKLHEYDLSLVNGHPGLIVRLSSKEKPDNPSQR